MVWNKEIMEIAQFCFRNKITLKMNHQSEMNSAHYEVEENKIVFIISICNEKDEKLNEIINNGFNNLKNFIQEFSTK